MVQENRVKTKIVVVCGPTGVGKTEITLKLAEALGGEIIVADSQAVLKKFDIGTAKPTAEEQDRVPHHLIDVAEFGELFDASTFARLADQALSEILSRKKIPIVSGGTGLYLKAFLFGMMEAPSRDDEFRNKLEKRAEEEGLSSLYEELQNVDGKRASQIHPNDALRIIRALEIHHLSGQTPTELSQSHGFKEARYDALKIGLKRPREELYQRINDRVLAMLNHGWVEEVKKLMASGIDLLNERTPTLGYPTLARYLNGEIFIKEAIEEIQKETRKLAKRQLTWFRADPEIQWFSPESYPEILEKIREFLGKT
ncbi:MAG: tRNA (adenosine(37)-N6)-dimethylallyltransferase MiaA [bacterium]